jgi:flagellar biosynthesis/type III secretory pathway protein FliH
MASIIRATHISADAVTLGVPPSSGAGGRKVRLVTAIDRTAEMRSHDGEGDEFIAIESDSGGTHVGMGRAHAEFEGPLQALVVDPAGGWEAGGAEVYVPPHEAEDAEADEHEESSRRHGAEMEELQQRLTASRELLANERAQMEADIEEIRSEARNAGFEQGLAEGMEAAQERIEIEIQQLRHVVEQLGGLEQQAMKLAEDSLVEMSFMAVCKLLGDAVLNGSAISGVVSQLIERTRGMRVTRIRMRSEDCGKLLELLASGALGVDCKGIDFQPDDSIGIGGCVLEGDAGTLDGRLESQLENLKATLLAARASSV